MKIYLLFVLIVNLLHTTFGYYAWGSKRLSSRGETSVEKNVTYVCETGWKYFNQSCFLIDNGFQYQSYQVSLDWCRNFGADLASIHSMDEDKFINQLIESSPQALAGKCKVNWIGLTCFCSSANSYDCAKGCWWADSTPSDLVLIQSNNMQMGVELGVFKVSQSCQYEWNSAYITGGMWISNQKDNYFTGYICRKNATIQNECGTSTGTAATPKPKATITSTTTTETTPTTTPMITTTMPMPAPPPLNPHDQQNPNSQNPINPPNPFDPQNPSNPQNPIYPLNPQNPIDPQNPNNPQNPDYQQNPSYPQTPENYVDPVNPHNPQNPQYPFNSQSPLNPENPINPSKEDSLNSNDQPPSVACVSKLMAEELAKGNSDPNLRNVITEKCKNKSSNSKKRVDDNLQNEAAQMSVEKNAT